MDGQPAPDAALDLIACNCFRVCIIGKCECIEYGMKCTDMCKLTDCENQCYMESDIEESPVTYTMMI